MEHREKDGSGASLAKQKRLAALELKKSGKSVHVQGIVDSPQQHRSNTKRKNKNKRKNDKNKRTDSARDDIRDNDPETVKRQKTREKLEKAMTNTRGEDSLSESRRQALENLTTPNDTITTNKNAPSGSGQDREGVYEAYTDGVLDVLPWMEGDGRSLEDLVHDLLLTNPRYSNNVHSIVDKLKDKTILMDNPDKKKKTARKRNLKPIGVAPAGRKELQSLGALNVKNMGLKYDDLLPIHYMWREYKDMLLDGTKSFQEMQQLAQRVDLHGCYAVVSKAREARHVGLCGIVVADSSTSYHILDKSDKCVVLPKVSTEIEFELQAGKKMTLFSKE